MIKLLNLSKLFIILAIIFSFAKAEEIEITQIDSENIDIHDYQDVPISIDAGNPISMRYNLAGYLCTLISEYSGSDCSVSPSNNSFSSISNVQRLKSDISIVQSDWFMHALNGTSRFIEIGKNNNLKVLSIFQGDRVYLFVKSPSKIASFNDLTKTKNIDLYIPETKNYDYVFTKAMLANNGAFKKITNKKAYNLNDKRLIKSICESEKTTALIKLLPRNSLFAENMLKCGYDVLSIDKKLINKMVEKITGSYNVKNHFNGKKYDTIGFKTIVAVNSNNSRDAIKSVRFIIENNIKNINKNFQEYHISSKSELSFDKNLNYFKKIK